MTTKTTLRAFCAVIFALGAMSMNAQTVGENLLLNPGFEDPDDGLIASMPTNWSVVPEAWFEAYYGTDPTYTAAGATISNPRADYTWFNTTYPDMASLLTGNFSARIPGNATGGMYQVVDVTPGATYEYGCDIAFRDNTNNYTQDVNSDVALKILSVDGEILGLDSENNQIGITYLSNFTPTSTANADGHSPRYFYINMVRGEITIPSGVTQVRFQLDERSLKSPKLSPVMVWDECYFRLMDDQQGIQTPQANASVSVSPNPAQTDITVSGTVSGAKIKLFNVGGILLQTVPAQDNSTSVDVSSLPKGLYLLQTGGQTVKLIKR